MFKKEVKELKCGHCGGVFKEYNSYKVIKEKLNEETQIYERYNICFNCVKKIYLEFFGSHSKSENIYSICKMFNLYYDFGLVILCDDIGKYLRMISSLPQYNGLNFKDSIQTENSTIRNVNNKSNMSDLEFLEHDISEVKIKISKALSSNDVNQHGKWLNSLRDALELKSRIKEENDDNKRKDVITNFNINIDGSNTENIDNEKIQEIINGFVRKKVKQPMYIIENNVYGYKITDSNKHDEIKYQIKDEQGKVVGVASDIEWINPI